MGWHRFAPEENKENENDTDSFCDGSRRVTHLGCLGDIASGADCASQRSSNRRSKQCDAGLLASLASLAWSSPLLARPLGPGALPLVVIRFVIRFAAPVALGAAILLPISAPAIAARV